jgi:hypothetical protein
MAGDLGDDDVGERSDASQGSAGWRLRKISPAVSQVSPLFRHTIPSFDFSVFHLTEFSAFSCRGKIDATKREKLSVSPRERKADQITDAILNSYAKIWQPNFKLLPKHVQTQS